MKNEFALDKLIQKPPSSKQWSKFTSNLIFNTNQPKNVIEYNIFYYYIVADVNHVPLVNPQTKHANHSSPRKIILNVVQNVYQSQPSIRIQPKQKNTTIKLFYIY